MYVYYIPIYILLPIYIATYIYTYIYIALHWPFKLATEFHSLKYILHEHWKKYLVQYYLYFYSLVLFNN